MSKSVPWCEKDSFMFTTERKGSNKGYCPGRRVIVDGFGVGPQPARQGSGESPPPLVVVWPRSVDVPRVRAVIARRAGAVCLLGTIRGIDPSSPCAGGTERAANGDTQLAGQTGGQTGSARKDGEVGDEHDRHDGVPTSQSQPRTQEGRIAHPSRWQFESTLRRKTRFAPCAPARSPEEP